MGSQEVVGYPRDGTGATEVGAAGGGCRRQVWRRKTSCGVEDASGGGRGVGRRGRRRKQRQSSRWKGVAEGGSPYSYPFSIFVLLRVQLPSCFTILKLLHFPSHVQLQVRQKMPSPIHSYLCWSTSASRSSTPRWLPCQPLS